MALWQLQVLGSVSLERDERIVTPDRKSAAILSYLALEGPTSRSKLAGLLWPDVLEATARNNLSQTLRRLRQATGEALIVGDDPLRLSAELSVDAADLKVRAFSGDAQEVVTRSGELLAGFDFDELAEFVDWLYGEREVLRGLYRQAVETLLERSEKAGRFQDAVPYAEALVKHDPISESAHRTLMRLYYLSGDRPAALKAYHRCKETLARELGVEPLPETKALARKIDHGEVQVSITKRVEPSLPAFVLRPPALVGREEAWEKMDEAWEKGQAIYLTGDPGIGKTRLAQEFVASKGRGLYLPARPGYQDVPFAGAVGLARARIAAAPDVVLPEWVEVELSRILPELLRGQAPPPLRGEEERLRFFQAYLEMVKRTGAGFVAAISDDVQYYDQATVELGGFMMAQPRSATSSENIPRYVIVYRRGELPPASQAFVNRLVGSEVAISIDLEPLDLAATTSLLVSLQLEAFEDGVTPQLAETVHRRTGGNMLFILETLRNLIEIERLGTVLPAGLPLPSKVDAIIRQRLARLSPGALRVAKTAAVLGSDFDLEIIGEVLSIDPFELVGAWEELEHAQVFSGSRFSHDLLYETVLNTVSSPVRALLNRRSAEVLDKHNANPVRIANHWLAAEDEMAAVPALRRAAERAVNEMRLKDAEQVFGQITEILERHGRTAEAAEAAAERQRVLERTPARSS